MSKIKKTTRETKKESKKETKKETKKENKYEETNSPNPERRKFLAGTGMFLTSAFAASINTLDQTAQGSAGTKGGRTHGSKGAHFSKDFTPAKLSTDDAVNISADYRYHLVAGFGDKVGPGVEVGENADFTVFIPGKNDDHGFLWINNEAFSHHLVWGKNVTPSQKTKAEVDAERKLVGGTYVELSRKNRKWTPVKDSKNAFRIDATTPIPLVGPIKKRMIEGTMGNCGGGITPWGAILTCEENTDEYYSFENLDDGFGWNKFYKKNKKDYGWVVEVDPQKKTARKLAALGRFAHEGATVVAKKGKKVVVYMGEDRRGGALFKFVSKGTYQGKPASDKDLLMEGKLFAANLEVGAWEELSPSHPKLLSNKKTAKKYSDMGSILEDAADVAKIIGATPLNRAEDIEVDPKTGDVMIALTNNSKAGDFYGQILKVSETKDHADSQTFTHEPYLVGGPSAGFACPDNLCYGPDGALYIATDVSGGSLGHGAMKPFKKNGLFKVEFDAASRPVAVPVLFCPPEAEVTGPCFSADGSTMFVSIQHPGELSFIKSNKYTSHWPEGKGRPKSTVIAVTRKA